MCSAKAIRRHACKIYCCWYLVGGLFAKVLPSPFFLPAKYTLPPSPPTQHRMGTIVLQTPGSTSQPVLASTTAPSANVRKTRTRFHNPREAQKSQKPAPASQTVTLPFTKGLPSAVLSQPHQVISLETTLNYNIPQILKHSPTGTWSPNDFFRVYLSGMLTFLFNAMRTWKEEINHEGRVQAKAF